jgi:hypothetical protein
MMQQSSKSLSFKDQVLDTLTQHKLIKDKIHDMRYLIKKDVIPYLDELEKEARLSPGFFKRLAQQNLIDPFSLNPEDSTSKSSVLFVNLIEEIGRINSGLGLTYLGNTMSFLLIKDFLNKQGDPSLSVILEDLLSGTTRGGFSLKIAKALDDDQIIVEDMLNAPISDTYVFFYQEEQSKRFSLCVTKTSSQIIAKERTKFMGCKIASLSDVVINKKDIFFLSNEEFTPNIYKSISSIFRVGTSSLLNAINLKILKILTQDEKKSLSSEMNNLIVEVYTRYRVLKSILHEAAYRQDRNQKIEKESNLARLHAVENLNRSLNTLQAISGEISRDDIFQIDKLWGDLSFFIRGDDYSKKKDLNQEVFNLIQDIKLF